MPRPTIACLGHDPTEADARRFSPRGRIVHATDGWQGAPGTLVGVVTASTLGRFLEAAAAGWDLVIRLDLHGERRRLALEDLRRIGELIEAGADDGSPVLDPIDDDLLQQLSAGATVKQAARAVGMSERTAARRLVGLRETFDAATTAAVVARWQRLRLSATGAGSVRGVPPRVTDS